jgi:hypothetical protein
VKKTVVKAFVHEIKVVNEGVEMWVRCEDIEGFVMGHLMSAVDQVDKDSSSMCGEVSIL